jgi:hypothetical protein
MQSSNIRHTHWQNSNTINTHKTLTLKTRIEITAIIETWPVRMSALETCIDSTATLETFKDRTTTLETCMYRTATPGTSKLLQVSKSRLLFCFKKGLSLFPFLVRNGLNIYRCVCFLDWLLASQFQTFWSEQVYSLNLYWADLRKQIKLIKLYTEQGTFQNIPEEVDDTVCTVHFTSMPS